MQVVSIWFNATEYQGLLMARTKKVNPTLEDVAAYSGVSIATVHRVITASGAVNGELEQRVKTAIQKLGFKPKRSKARVKPPAIVLIAPEFLNPANTTVIAGAQEEAEKLDVRLVILPVGDQPESRKQNLTLLKQLPVDGIILFHLRIEPDEVRKLCSRDTPPPIVQIGRVLESPSVHCIDTDRTGGMYQATQYLLSLNHKDIAYISGPLEREYSQSRLRGIERALTEAGLTLHSDFHPWCFPTIEDGFQAASSLLRLPSGKRPTAILAFNDLMAIGTLHAVRTCGLTVPDDISVVGFDNIAITAHTNPPLTTVAQSKYQMGQMAVQKLFRSVRGYDTGRGGFTLLECPLVVRESTGPCPQKP